jgi:hypothetical protein
LFDFFQIAVAAGDAWLFDFFQIAVAAGDAWLFDFFAKRKFALAGAVRDSPGHGPVQQRR